MIDAEVDGRHLVADRTVWSLPLDHDRPSTSEPVTGLGERLPVGEGHGEGRRVSGVGQQALEPLPLILANVGDDAVGRAATAS